MREGEDTVEAVSSRTAAENEVTRRQAFLQSLRACADFLESHPDVQAPRYVVMNVFVQTREEVAAHAKAAAWTKTYNGRWFYLSHAFGPDVQLDITTDREVVCRRVVTGQRVVPAQPEHTVDDVKWLCDTALLEETAS